MLYRFSLAAGVVVVDCETLLFQSSVATLLCGSTSVIRSQTIMSFFLVRTSWTLFSVTTPGFEDGDFEGDDTAGP